MHQLRVPGAAVIRCIMFLCYCCLLAPATYPLRHSITFRFSLKWKINSGPCNRALDGEVTKAYFMETLEAHIKNLKTITDGFVTVKLKKFRLLNVQGQIQMNLRAKQWCRLGILPSTRGMKLTEYLSRSLWTISTGTAPSMLLTSAVN